MYLEGDAGRAWAGFSDLSFKEQGLIGGKGPENRYRLGSMDQSDGWERKPWIRDQRHEKRGHGGGGPSGWNVIV